MTAQGFNIEKKEIKRIPASVKKYFWDCDFNLLDLNINRDFILKRLLNFGDLDAIKFVLNEYSNEEVNLFVNKMGKKVLSRPSLLFWQKVIKNKNLWKRS